MKYFPLVWAALWRRPTRLILTLLSVSVAFTLFGVTIGFNASVQDLIARSLDNRIFVYASFGGPSPLAYKEQIARVPGVTNVAYNAGIPGYYQDKKNSVFVIMADDGSRNVMKETSLTPANWDQLQATRSGVFITQRIAARYHLKAGDAFPVLTVAATRADGTKSWPFTVLSVVDDIPQAPNGAIFGNYEFLDQSRPLAQRGTVNAFQILVDNPDHADQIAHTIETMFANSGTPMRAVTDKASSESASQAGINIPFVTTVVAAAGLFMILFLTGNGIAQSVRERIPEFAMLKTLGFSDAGVMALVFVEAAIPCLLGAAIGIGIAKVFAQALPKLFPPNFGLPIPYMSPGVLSLAFVFAVIVAFVSAVIPALRIKRLDVAAALSGR